MDECGYIDRDRKPGDWVAGYLLTPATVRVPTQDPETGIYDRSPEAIQRELREAIDAEERKRRAREKRLTNRRDSA